MITIERGILRDENATEVNELVKEVIDKLELESEAINERIMDLSLDNTEYREKTFAELMENPEELYEMAELLSKRQSLDLISKNLRNAIYKDYEKIPVEFKKPAPKQLNQRDCLLWLATQVKPLILDGENNQRTIAKKLSTPQSTLSKRVTRAYEVSWEEYVEFVIQGIY